VLGTAKAFGVIATKAVTIRVYIPDGTALGIFLVHNAVTVIVKAIANLGGVGVDRSIGIIAIAIDQGRIGRFGTTEAGTVQPDPITIIVAIGEVRFAVNCALFVNDSVTVVINSVAGLHRIRVDCIIIRLAIEMVRDSVAIVIVVQAISSAVAIGVGGIRAELSVEGAWVFIVGNAVTINVIVDAISDSVGIQIFEVFVNLVITVVIQPVTELFGTRMNLVVFVVTVAGNGDVTIGPFAKTGAFVATKAVSVAIEEPDVTVQSTKFVDFAIAIVVLAIANFRLNARLIAVAQTIIGAFHDIRTAIIGQVLVAKTPGPHLFGQAGTPALFLRQADSISGVEWVVEAS
jgi:hypothetical protein